MTRENVDQHGAECPASGSEVQDSWAPLALGILTYLQELERHWTTLHFRLKSVRKALKSGLSRQGVQPLISVWGNARAISAAPKAAAPLKQRQA